LFAHIWTPENGLPLYDTLPPALPVGLGVVTGEPGVVVVLLVVVVGLTVVGGAEVDLLVVELVLGVDVVLGVVVVVT
jgi:hypothetical protein